MSCTRGLLQSVQMFVKSHYFTRHFTATSRQTRKNILIEVRLNKSLVYIKMTQTQITLTRNRTQKMHTRTRHSEGKRLTKIYSFALLEAARHYLGMAFTTHPSSSTFQVYTHLASTTFSAGYYTGAKVPACSRPLTLGAWSVAIFPRAVTSPPHKRSSEFKGLVHARSEGPERRRVGVRSRVRLHSYPALAPRPHGPMVDHGDGRIPVTHRALHGSRRASSRASQRIPHLPVRG